VTILHSISQLIEDREKNTEISKISTGNLLILSLH